MYVTNRILLTSLVRRMSLSSCLIQLTKADHRWSEADDNYQFVHKSDVPTFSFQKSLRRLPIPKLADSCRRLIEAGSAVLLPGQLAILKNDVDEFENNEGPELQRELLVHDKRNKHTSFISEPWYDMYLSDRSPCPINYNPFMTYAPDPDPAYNNQLTRATNLIISFGRIKRSLDANCLTPEIFYMRQKTENSKMFRLVCKSLPESVRWYGAAMFGAFPLDMSQYNSLFGGSRIPEIDKDRLYHCSECKNFVVLRRGKMYSVELFDKRGQLVPPDQVHACLSYILNDSDVLQPEECVSSLTTFPRDEWAKVRSELISVCDDNASRLKLIDGALFVVCLDETDSDDPKQLMRNLLAGGNASNRWFDKCFQLIVDARGAATINFEHSWGDGVAVLRLLNESFFDTCRNHFVMPKQAVNTDINVRRHVLKIKFKITPSIRQKILEAQENHVSKELNLCYGTAEYFGMNRKFIKRSGLSPDAIMQLAIQLTYYKLYKEFVPTYESCSTAAFLKGRTECVRSATRLTRDFVLAVQNKKNVKVDMIKKCSSLHSRLVREAATGHGFDRHFLGLRVTAERLGLWTPKLYSSETFKYMNRFIISTSTLSAETISFGGFGPVVPEGFGIGYNVAENRLGATVTAYKVFRDAGKFADILLESLDVIKSIIDTARH